jgi:hypothetical protein
MKALVFFINAVQIKKKHIFKRVFYIKNLSRIAQTSSIDILLKFPDLAQIEQSSFAKRLE